MNRARIALGANILFAAIALTCAPFLLWAAFTPVVHVVGTVTTVIDDECVVRYTDLAGDEHTYSNYGGKYGCSDSVGDDTDLYYHPDDPSDPDTMSPLENAAGGLMMLGIGALFGGSAVCEVRDRDGIRRRRRGRRPRHRQPGGRHAQDP